MTVQESITSILGSVKRSCNIPDDVDVFDAELILLINTTFAKLHQMGVGPESVFSIEDSGATWDEFSTNPEVAMAKTYVFLETRLVFDPPTASVLTAMEKKRDELEWRLNVADDKPLHDIDIETGGNDSNDDV